MAAEIFFAEDGELYICPAGSTLDASITSRNRYKFSDYVTEISVSGAGRDTEQIQTFGKDTSARQNSILKENPQEQLETSLTAVVRDYKLNEMLFGTGSTASGVTTVTGAKARGAKDIYYRFDDGTSQLEVKFTNALAISSDMSNAADGYLEESIGFKCLAKNYRKKHSAARASGSAFPYSGQFA